MSKRAVFAVFLSLFAAMVGLGAICPILPVIAGRVGANGIWLGIIFSSFAVSRGISMPFMGNLSDRIGHKILISSGLLILAVVSSFYIFARNVYEFTAVRLLHGIAAGMIIPVVMAYVGNFVTKGKEAKSMGMFNMMFYFSVALGPLLGGNIGGRFGFDAVFYTLAALSGTALIFAVFFIPGRNKYAVTVPKGAEKFRDLIKRDTVKAILLITLTNAIRVSVIMAFAPVYGAEMGVSEAGIGVVISVCIMTAGILQPFFGHVSDTKQKKWKFHQIMAGAGISTAGFAAIPFCHGFAAMIAASIVIGLGFAVTTPVTTGISVLIGHRIGMGAWMGVFNASMSVGTVLGPLLAGAILDDYGIKSVFFMISGISVAGIGICYHYFLRRLRTAA
ncbi:MAG: MFS transporter [Candidatus Omnitrophota bacterium]